MAETSFQEVSASILEEVRRALSTVREEEAEALRAALRQASGAFVTGEGRSGLVGRCFAMRLMHLGLRAHVIGETTTPAVGASDLLVAISGTGESEVTCGRARLAASKGARVAAITAARESALARGAHLALVIPAGAAGSEQYGGSAFEQAALIAMEAIAFQLQRELERSAREMDERHATVE